MPIILTKHWQNWVDKNQDPYGKYCVDVARRVMELIDEGLSKSDYINAHKLISMADKELGGGLSGFQAGAVYKMVNDVHSRGEEFGYSYANGTSMVPGGNNEGQAKAS